MDKANDNKYMRRCLDLAVKAEGLTYPNPVVGAVLVCDGNIAGEGYHLYAGGPHAEVIAVNSVKDKELLKGSTLYVSLEPCSHFGKTPPCTDLIISSGIPRIVVGTIDTSGKVSGRGIEKLKKAGREVMVGVMEDECRRVNRRFFTFHEKKRPYITLKWAQSADGFIDMKRPEGSTPEPYWITGMTERVLVHKWRAEEEAILVGGETVRKDNPALNVRYWKGRDPLRIILSGSGNLGKYIADNVTKSRIITFTYNNKEALPEHCTRVLLQPYITAAEQVCEALYNEGVQSLFIEGGAVVMEHFISCGLWDEARIFTGRSNFSAGVKAPVVEGKEIEMMEFEKSSLKIVVNKMT